MHPDHKLDAHDLRARALDDLAQLVHDFRDQRRQFHRLDPKLHRPRLGLRDVHQGVQHHQELVQLFQTFADGLTHHVGIPIGLQRELRGAADPHDRGAQLVGDVVEGPPHAFHERGDPFQHLVEQEDELVQLVAASL